MNASVVSNILSAGMMVGIRMGSNTHWYGNVIYEVTDSSIRTAYIKKSMADNVYENIPACVKYSNDYFIYYFYGKVTEVNRDFPGSILIKLENVEEIINNRLFPRYDVKLKALLKSTWDNEIFEGTVTDLSYGGALFVCNHRFDVNENIEMSLFLPNKAVVKLTGKVVRHRIGDNNLFSQAAQFIEYDNTNNQQLTEYIIQLEDEASKIYRQYLEQYNQENCCR